MCIYCSGFETSEPVLCTIEQGIQIHVMKLGFNVFQREINQAIL